MKETLYARLYTKRNLINTASDQKYPSQAIFVTKSYLSLQSSKLIQTPLELYKLSVFMK